VSELEVLIGEPPRAYLAGLAPGGAVLVRPAGVDLAAAYRLTWAPEGWSCTCPAYIYRRYRSGPCKHALAAVSGAFDQLLEGTMDEQREAPRPDLKAVALALAAPFDPAEVKWKAQVVSGNRAMVVAFVDARVIQDRLDDVVGVMGWQDAYETLPDGAVTCRLKIRVGQRWITKMDVGGQSEQPDEGDRRKAAFSDALKRAAVKFGIGRYLYRLEPQWVDYDPQKKRITGTPRLPASALLAGALPARQPAPAAEQQTTAPLMATQEQIDQFGHLLTELKFSDEKVLLALGARRKGADNIRQLTAGQAAEVITSLQNIKAARQAQGYGNGRRP
jgi:hypothetical protein